MTNIHTDQLATHLRHEVLDCCSCRAWLPLGLLALQAQTAYTRSTTTRAATANATVSHTCWRVPAEEWAEEGAGWVLQGVRVHMRGGGGRVSLLSSARAAVGVFPRPPASSGAPAPSARECACLYACASACVRDLLTRQDILPRRLHQHKRLSLRRIFRLRVHRGHHPIRLLAQAPKLVLHPVGSIRTRSAAACGVALQPNCDARTNRCDRL